MARASPFVLSLISSVLTSLTIGNAFFQKKQFYPSVVYITKSSPSMAVIYIQFFVIAYLVFQIVRKLFFGELRASEIEHLSERTWHAVMETCLAFTVFRDNFSPRFVMQFVLLLFVKSFHWLSEDRVDYMERSPVITVLFHCRMMSLLAFLSAVDSYFMSHAYFTTLLHGASVQIVFGFEYAILMTAVLYVAIKYILHMHDLRNVHPWENKAVALLYSELLINFLRCLLYVIFVAVMIRLHTFPLFSIRPLYLTIRAFHKAINDVILSRRAIHAMNNLFPIATEQDLLQGDNTCIICREEMTAVSGAKKLPCSHIFHANCLRSWFQRQQSCPTCRTDILSNRRQTTHIPRPGQPAANAPGGPAAAANAANQGAQNGGAPAGNFGGAEIPNMFPFMAQYAFPQGPQQPQEQGQGQTGAPSTSQQPNIPPQQCFFPFMPLPPHMYPQFPEVPTFAGLTDGEVAALEGNERAAIEARVKCLRNISLLLDAAVLQFHQYMSVVQHSGVPSADISAVPSSNVQQTTTPTAIVEQPGRTLAENLSEVSPRDRPVNADPSSDQASTRTPTGDSADSNIADSASSSSTATNANLAEIRQRRLEKLSATGTTADRSDD